MPGAIRTRVHYEVQMQGQITGRAEYDRALGVTEGFPAYTVQLADGTTDQSIAALTAGSALTTISTVLLMTDQNITVKIGTVGSNQAFALNANGVLVLHGTSITALALSNASGSTANVTIGGG